LNSVSSMSGTKKSRPTNKHSLLLSPEENEQVFRCLGSKNYTLSTAVAQLLSVEHHTPDLWVSKQFGVVCLVKDYNARGYFLRMYDIKKGFIVWEQEVYDEFSSTRLCDELLAFEGDYCMFGLNFASVDEANDFHCQIQKLQNRIAERESASRTVAPSEPHSMYTMAPTYSSVTSMSVVMPFTSVTSGLTATQKAKRKKSRRKIDKKEIGNPTNFEHRAHIGWDKNKGFTAEGEGADPELKAILSKLNLPTDFQETEKQAIYSVINQMGGIEAVTRQLKQEKPVHNRSTVAVGMPNRNMGIANRAGPPPSRPALPAARDIPTPVQQPQRPLPPSGYSSLSAGPPAPQIYGGRYQESTTMASTVSNVAQQPPPPPPPPPPLLSAHHQPPMMMFHSEEMVPKVPAAPPPPAPPPPPPFPTEIVASVEDKFKSARSNLLDEIRRGKALKHVDERSSNTAKEPAAAVDNRMALMNQIAQGVNLKPVEKMSHSNAKDDEAEKMGGIAGALARALLERRGQMGVESDSSDEDDDDDDDEDNEWDEILLLSGMRVPFLRLLKRTDLIVPYGWQLSSGRRALHLQEYHSKQLLDNFGLTVQKFIVVEAAEEAAVRLHKFVANEYVVKAQILAGGRGKGRFDNGLEGGVKLARSSKQAIEYVKKMVNHRLFTNQTSSDGILVKKVMIAESVPIWREGYLAIMVDRTLESPLIIASPSGGVDIEDVSVKSPELMLKLPIDLEVGLSPAVALKIAKFLQFSENATEKAKDEILHLYEMFVRTDATMIEVNPICETTNNDGIYLVDAKLHFDDNAFFRQREIFALTNLSDRDPRELEAELYGLNFVSMDGNIGCLVNGAGLAMATMDLIKLHGGEPANFLDVGGSADASQVSHGIEIISHDPKVKAIFVNIFGGIVNCQTIARGVIAAMEKIGSRLPIILRLEGTDDLTAKRLLRESHYTLLMANNMEHGVSLSIEAISSDLIMQMHLF
ncbi:putative succinyl-CoA ligase [GDP-forming] subunit beta, mitochondrial, partial [Trichinella papuae]